MTTINAFLPELVLLCGALALFVVSLGECAGRQARIVAFVTAVAAIVASVACLGQEATLFFRKDHELRKTIREYHKHMLSSQRPLTMTDVAETIQNSVEQDRMKREIILSTLGIK